MKHWLGAVTFEPARVKIQLFFNTIVWCNDNKQSLLIDFYYITFSLRIKFVKVLEGVPPLIWSHIVVLCTSLRNKTAQMVKSIWLQLTMMKTSLLCDGVTLIWIQAYTADISKVTFFCVWFWSALARKLLLPLCFFIENHIKTKIKLLNL